MIEKAPKSQKLPKGQRYSVAFFQKIISENLQNVKRKIKNIMEIKLNQSKRKGKKIQILSYQQYMKLYFHSYSFQYHYEKSDVNVNSKAFIIIDENFLNNNPLFYKTKWRIYFDDLSPSIKVLAILNHLSYGYFTEVNNQKQIASVLNQQNNYTYKIRNGLLINIGTIKLYSRKEDQFNYFDYVYYSPKFKDYQHMENDPRVNFTKSQLHIIERKQQKKNLKPFMSIEKLRYGTGLIEDDYQCPSYLKRVSQKNECQQYLFQLQNYHSKQHVQITETEQQIQEGSQTSQQSQIITKSLMKIERSGKLVSHLQKIPNFQFNLSNQEKQVIQTKGNLIVIGRSGTGKTTCALLKLFSLELLLKHKSIIGRKFQPSDIYKCSGMRNLFITFSPFLIQQLKKQYQKLLRNVKLELQKKQLKGFQESTIILAQNKFESALDKLKQLQNKLRRQNNIHCLGHLEKDDFPGFITVRSLLIMIDGIYKINYFKRNDKKQLYLHKRNQITEQNVLFVRNKEGIYQKSQQINYDYFRQFFWNNIKKHLQFDFSPLVVWTEIFSVIQGSALAYRYPQSCVSQQNYINLSKDRFLTQGMKREIYRIFKIYKQWKINLNKFDQCDFVNYLLRKFEKHSYIGPKINCLFLDEVQDLTPAMIFLISQIASNNIYYSGDTAQLISKGVSFKFSDIKLLFLDNKQKSILNKEKPEIKQLTTNFRSHSNILKVANCVTKIIQILFPKNIDILKKEISIITGPKPVHVMKKQEFMKILNVNRHKKQQFYFTNKQAIIVRDDDKKQEVKKLYPKAIVLSIHQSKGLEFEDVVLWEILDKQPQNLIFLWKIIEYIQIKESPQNLKSKTKDLFQMQQNTQIDKIQNILAASKKLLQYDLNQYYQLCSQLKLLYTALTRSKETLIFYGNYPKQLINLWIRLSLIQKYSPEYEKQVEVFKILKKSNLQRAQENQQMLQWRKSGIDFIKKQNYQQALICFENGGDKNACLWVEAKILILKGKRMKQYLKINKLLLTNQIIQKKQRQIIQTFTLACQKYQKINNYEEAGQIYFEVKLYEDALRCFDRVNMLYEVGECYSKLGKHKEAGQTFQRIQKYIQMINEFQKIQDYLFIFSKLLQFKQQFEDFQTRKSNIFKRILHYVQKIIKQQIKANLPKQEHKNYKQKKIIRSYQNLNIPIQQLKLLVFIQLYKITNKAQFQQYLTKQLQYNKIHKLFSLFSDQVCLAFSIIFQIGYFQDYFLAIGLESCLKNNRKINQQLMVNSQMVQYLRKLDLNQLIYVQQTKSCKLIQKISKILVLSGFVQASQIFLQKKSFFYFILLKQRQFLVQINNNKYRVLQGQQKINYFNFMKYPKWYNQLLPIETIYSFKIFHNYFILNQRCDRLKKQLNNAQISLKQNIQAFKKLEVQNKQVKSKKNNQMQKITELTSQVQKISSKKLAISRAIEKQNQIFKKIFRLMKQSQESIKLNKQLKQVENQHVKKSQLLYIQRQNIINLQNDVRKQQAEFNYIQNLKANIENKINLLNSMVKQVGKMMSIFLNSQFTGLKFQGLPNIISDFYSGKDINLIDIERVIKFNKKQKDQIKIFQTILLVILIIDEGEIGNNIRLKTKFYEFIQRIIQLLLDPRQNCKFIEILLVFYGFRSFSENHTWKYLKDYVIVEKKNQIRLKWKLKGTQFDINKRLQKLSFKESKDYLIKWLLDQFCRHFTKLPRNYLSIKDKNNENQNINNGIMDSKFLEIQQISANQYQIKSSYQNKQKIVEIPVQLTKQVQEFKSRQRQQLFFKFQHIILNKNKKEYIQLLSDIQSRQNNLQRMQKSHNCELLIRSEQQRTKSIIRTIILKKQEKKKLLEEYYKQLSNICLVQNNIEKGKISKLLKIISSLQQEIKNTKVFGQVLNKFKIFVLETVVRQYQQNKIYQFEIENKRKFYKELRLKFQEDFYKRIKQIQHELKQMDSQQQNKNIKYNKSKKVQKINHQANQIFDVEKEIKLLKNQKNAIYKYNQNQYEEQEYDDGQDQQEFEEQRQYAEQDEQEEYEQENYKQQEDHEQQDGRYYENYRYQQGYYQEDQYDQDYYYDRQ